MFKTENAQLVPNLLAKTTEEDENYVKNVTGLLKDSTNTRDRVCRLNKMKPCGGERNFFSMQMKNHEIQLGEDKQEVKQNSKQTKTNNFLINFDSSQEQSELDEAKQVQSQNSQTLLNIENYQSGAYDSQNLQKQQTIPKKIGFLLQIDFSQEEQQPEFLSKSVQQKNVIKEQKFGEDHINDVLLKLQNNSDLSEKTEQQSSYESDRDMDCNRRAIIRLAAMQSKFQNNYYLEPIPLGAVFQCVVKRDKCQSLLKYHLYDCVSLRNFITIIKDSEGYLVVCKQGNKGQSPPQKQTVVGRIVSNFFGTQFNCTLQNTPYIRGYSYPIIPKKENVITIEYQTNFFGLKGPRKISAFIPMQKEHKYEPLSQIYQKQKKKKLKPSVLKFKNKTPQWCKEIDAYVLNFGGRASVSSIKNFVLVGQNQGESAQQKILFGKFGRQLFNLDIRYPFSILQGVCLAVSSFDRKLACQ